MRSRATRPRYMFCEVCVPPAWWRPIPFPIASAVVMAAELSAALVDAALQLAGIAEQGADWLAPDDDRLLPERLGAHNVLSYAVAGEAETYRRIMRILYLEHQAFGLRLRPAQIADRLRERYGLGLDTELLDQRL